MGDEDIACFRFDLGEVLAFALFDVVVESVEWRIEAFGVVV